MSHCEYEMAQSSMSQLLPRCSLDPSSTEAYDKAGAYKTGDGVGTLYVTETQHIQGTSGVIKLPTVLSLGSYKCGSPSEP